ncbi:MAG: hypothetical protein QOI66_5417 [Myxococcales bacterium]|jgi:hypothetical protein|nr:hypothetical protein [Myxococcales bacterium]
MILPPCVSIELNANQPSLSSAAIVEERCGAILGKDRCHVSLGSSPSQEATASCWVASIDAANDVPLVATVVLHNPARPERRDVERSVEFRQRDAPADRWATLGLLIAALVTIEEHSATPPPPADSPDAAQRLRDAQRAAALLRATEQPPPAPQKIAVDIRASALLAAGMVPGTAWGLRGEVAIGTRRLAGLARFSYLPSRSETAPTAPRQGGDFRLWAPGVGLCWKSGEAHRLSMRICGGGDLNITAGQGFGISEPAQHTVQWGSLWAGVGAQLRLFSHAFVVAGLEGTAGIERPSFTLNSGDLYTVPPVGGYASLGLAVPY